MSSMRKERGKIAKLEVLPAGPQGPLQDESFHQWRNADGSTYASLHRVEGGHIVRFFERADFYLTNGSEIVKCRPAGSITDQAIRFLYANQIVPLLQNRAGKAVLHGSAICVDGRALGFVGQSGRGKSTLAAAFSVAGYPFLTDDGLLIERAEASFAIFPGNPNLRLWWDSEVALCQRDAADDDEDKRLLHASDRLPHHRNPLPLSAIYLLGPGEANAASVVPLPPQDAFNGLLQHAFILDIEDRARMRLQWDQLGALAEAVPCFALDYPRRYDALPGVLEAILDHARSGALAA